MKISLTQALAIIDSILALSKTVTDVTPGTRDDAIVAAIIAFRQKFAPIIGAEAQAELEPAIQEAVDSEFSKFEVTADES